MMLYGNYGGQIFKYVKTLYLNCPQFITNFATETTHTLPFYNFVKGYFSTNIDDKTSIYIKNNEHMEAFAKTAYLTFVEEGTEYSLYQVNKQNS